MDEAKGNSADKSHSAEPSAAQAVDGKKIPKPARVQLTSFALYRVKGAGTPSASIEVLAGAAHARFDPNGNVQLLACNVPFHSPTFANRGPKDGHGLLALYGQRDAAEELQFWRKKARELDAEFAYVTYDVVVDIIESQLVDRAALRFEHDISNMQLPDRKTSFVGFLNLRRTMTALQTSIHERFKGYVASEDGTTGTMATVAQIATRPDLFDRLFEDDKDFKHVSVFVIPVADEPEVPGKMRQVAYLRPGARIINTMQGSDHVEVLLPNWIPSEPEAKKLRKRENSPT